MGENKRKIERSLRSRVLVVVAALFSLIVGGCVDADSMFGDSFVPPNQELDTYIDSSMKVKTTLMKVDSLPSSGIGAVYIGAYHSDVFGDVRGTALSSFFPEGFESDTMWGVNPTFDSMQMKLDFNGCVGDTTFKMEISVHQIKDLVLSSDSLYYTNFDAEPFYEPTPLFEFVLSGDGDTTVTADLPESFYSTLLTEDEYDDNNPYNNDTVFIERFKGFYFKINNAPTTAEEGSIRQLSLSSSLMRLYYHNEQNGKVEADTTTHDYYFYGREGNSFTIFENDYSTTDIAKGGVDINDTLTGTELSRCMIQGFSGVGTKLELDTLQFERIKEEAKAKGYGHVALHSATIEWGLESRELGTPVDVKTMERASDRLGLYYNILDLETPKDYDPKSEMGNKDFVSDLGGGLNRSRKIYTQTITSAIQSVFNKPEGEYYKDNENYKYVMELLPSWDYIFFYSETVVGGSASLDNAPQIVLVYTLVK